MNQSNVLIIDDEPGNLDAYQQLLQAQGFGTKSISTGSEAVAIAADREFDAVIIDLRSPIQSVIDLAEKIKKSNPFCCIFLLTDELAPASIKKALDLGVENCLIKPFLPTILSESLKKAVQRMQLIKEKTKLEGELLALRQENNSLREGYEEIKKKLIWDPLTGTIKPECFIDRLDKEIKRVKRHEHWLSLILFKPHLENIVQKDRKDLLLKYLATFLSENLRSIDVLGRYEDGFTIILPETNEQGANALIQRLKREITKPFTDGFGEEAVDISKLKEKTTFSSSTYPTDSHLPKRLIRIAESRLI